ncbi:MAG: hypothetical protein ACLFO1_00620 [Spirochaetaceae bacterium]
MQRFTILAVALLVLAAPFAVSFDYGADVTTTSRIETEEDFFNRDTLLLWTEVPLGRNHLFQARGGYAFSTELPAELVLNRFVIQGDYNPTADTRLITQLGRIGLSTPSGMVFNHDVDGGSLRIQAPGATTRFGMGYTGFLFGPASQILVSIADTQVSTTDTFALATPRVVGTAEVTLSDLIPRQEITLAGTFQEDLRPVMDPAKLNTPLISPNDTDVPTDAGGPVDTQYVTLGINGGIASGLFYEAWGTYNAGSMLTLTEDPDTNVESYRPTPIRAFAAAAGLTYFRPQLLSLRVNGKFTYTSGDADHDSYFEGNTEGPSNLYQPINAAVASIAFAPRLGNIMYGELHLGVRPFGSVQSRFLRNLGVSSGVYVFARSTEGAVSATGVGTGPGSNYLGTEVDANVTYRPFSDLGLGVGVGTFFPNSGDESPMTNQAFRLRARLSTSLSF